MSFSEANIFDCLVQVALFDLLKKFDGETVTEVVRPKLARMRYRVTKSPPYLMFHMVRFKKNNFFKEKNPTLGKPVLTICDIKRFTKFRNAFVHL